MDTNLSALRIGSPSAVGRLSCFPLFGPSGDRGYISLGTALNQGTVSIGEVSDAGSVREIAIENRGKTCVLLLDGQELVGAKQNRIVNLTILVPAEDRLTIPVSCVEAHRWSSRSRGFSTAPHAYYASGRAKTVREGTAALERHGVALPSQAGIWEDVAAKTRNFRAHSPSGSVDAIFEAAAPAINTFQTHLSCQDGQTGGVFAIDGFVVGLEVLESAEHCREVWPSIVASFAVDAVDRHYAPPTIFKSPAEFVDSIRACETTTFPGVGLGKNVRMRGPAVAAAALVHAERLIHLNAFTVSEQ